MYSKCMNNVFFLSSFSGIYLSHASVITLICVSSLILIGAGTALVLVCRMKKRPFLGKSGRTPKEKIKEILKSDKGKADDNRMVRMTFYRNTLCHTLKLYAMIFVKCAFFRILCLLRSEKNS